MEIGVFGGGFVGITLAAHLLKSSEARVTVVDTSTEKLRHFQQNRFMVSEPGLDQILVQALGSSRLRFETKASDMDAIFICIGTPKELSYDEQIASIVSVALIAAKSLSDGGILLLRSTVPVGTTVQVKEQLVSAGYRSISVCFAPERTAEGVALEELERLPQILGAENSYDLKSSSDFLRKMGFNVVTCGNTQTAEMVKLVCNTWRDTTFAFANEVALLCESRGISAGEVIEMANRDYSRSNVPRPGHVGGPCLSKDAYILMSSFPGREVSLIRTARTINESIMVQIFSQLLSRFSHQRRIVIQFIGASFKGKPATNDVRKGVVEDLIDLQVAQSSDLSPKLFMNVWDDSLDLEDLTFFGEYIKEYGPEQNPDVVIFGNDSEWVMSESVKSFVQGLDSRTLIIDLWGVTRDWNPIMCEVYALGENTL